MNNIKLNEFIKYEDLVSKHNSQLIDKLRLHGSEDEVLSLWVPDENITKSFINLVSSLIEAKRDSYKISFAEQLFSEIVISEITKYFQNNLNVEYQILNKRIYCTLNNLTKSKFEKESLKEGQALELVSEVDYKYGEVFKKNIPNNLLSVIENYSKKKKYQETLISNNSHVILSSKNENCSISISYDIKSQLVVGFFYENKQNIKINGICEMIGELGINLPVLEFCEHILLKSIHQFINLSPAFKKSAIILPNNMGFEFMTINLVLQDLLKRLKDDKIDGKNSKINFYDKMPDQNWLSLSEKEKEYKVIQNIRNFEVESELKKGVINFLSITEDLDKWPLRITISLSDEVELIIRPKLLRVLEKSLRKNLESTLQIFYEESKDKSKIRRL